MFCPTGKWDKTKCWNASSISYGNFKTNFESDDGQNGRAKHNQKLWFTRLNRRALWSLEQELCAQVARETEPKRPWAGIGYLWPLTVFCPSSPANHHSWPVFTPFITSSACKVHTWTPAVHAKYTPGHQRCRSTLQLRTSSAGMLHCRSLPTYFKLLYLLN